jgi:S-methylmethionine-dependent homocysteine/selenocysteine methylase
MSGSRRPLPQLDGHLMLTDSGIETDIIFGAGRDLPAFAVFPLLEDEDGRAILDRYYREHVAVAAEHGLGYVLETPTWRSNPDWGTSLGYTRDGLDDLDRGAVSFLAAIRDSSPLVFQQMPLSGNLGPRGDGYQVGTVMSAEEAREYHGHQVRVFADAGCDLVSVLTLTYPNEGQGIAQAAKDADVPVVLYFTVETDGRLPDGSSLRQAIETIDDVTDGYVAYYGINCAHPDPIGPAVADGGEWTGRIRAVRANASRMSHAELDEAEVLDDGDPMELAADYVRLRQSLPNATVFGGCCGTDVRHVRAIASALAGP